MGPSFCMRCLSTDDPGLSSPISMARDGIVRSCFSKISIRSFHGTAMLHVLITVGVCDDEVGKTGAKSCPAPFRSRHFAYGRVTMVGNHRINDVPTVQAAPAVECHFAAHIHDVQEEVYDHTTLTTLTLHMVFSIDDVFSETLGRTG